MTDSICARQPWPSLTIIQSFVTTQEKPYYFFVYIWLVSLKNSVPQKNMVDYRAVLLKHLTHHFGVFTISVQPLEPGEAFAAISGWWSAPRGSWLLAAHRPLQQRHHQGILVSYLTNFPNAGLAPPLWISVSKGTTLFTNFPRILYCHWKKGMLQDLL